MNELINYSNTLIIAFCRTRMTWTKKTNLFQTYSFTYPCRPCGKSLIVPCSCVRYCWYLIYY